MVRKANIVQKQELGGGKGCAEVHEIVPEKDLYGHGKLYAKVVLKPNSSVGWHRHVGETEPYYILEGEGIFVDDDVLEMYVQSFRDSVMQSKIHHHAKI